VNWICLTTVFIIAILLDIWFVRIGHLPRDRQTSLLYRIRDTWPKFRKFLLPRWAWLLFSMLSITYGDYLMEKNDLISIPLSVAKSWQTIYRLDIVNINNVLPALRYLLLGCIILVWVAYPDEWKKPAQQQSLELNHGTLDRVYWIKHLIIIGIGLAFLLINLGEHHYETFFPLLWLILILWISRLFWTRDKRCQVDLSLGIARSDLAWMLGLFALALAVGSYALWDIPKILIPDEGAFWETARAIAKGEYLPAFFDFGVYTFPVASSIYQGWVMQLFGINVWGWRFSSVLAAAITVFPLYLLSREWFNRLIAIAACLLLVVNPYFISFARLGYNNSQALFPVVLSVFFFERGLKDNSYFYFWLAGLLAGLGYYTFFSAWLGLVVVSLSVFIFVITKKISSRGSLKIVLAIFAGALVMIAPRLAYGMSGNQKDLFVYKIFEASFTNAVYGETYYSMSALTRVSPLISIGQLGNLFYNPEIYGDLLERGMARTLLVPLDPYIVNEHFLVTGLAGAITPAFFLIGLGLSLRGLKQTRFQVMLIWLVSGMVLLSMVEAFPPRHPQMVILQPVMALFGAVGLSTVAEALANELIKKNKILRKGLFYGLIWTGLIVAMIFGIYKYYVQMPRTYPPTLEDIASWITWKSSRPAGIFFIQDSSNPSRLAYVFKTKMAPGSYHEMGIADFLAADFKLPEDELQHFIAFFPVDPNGEVATRLRQILPGRLEYATFYDNNHKVIGYAITNTSIQLQPDDNFFNNTMEVIETPASALILLALISSGMMALWKSKWVWPYSAAFARYKGKALGFRGILPRRIPFQRNKSKRDRG